MSCGSQAEAKVSEENEEMPLKNESIRTEPCDLQTKKCNTGDLISLER